MSKILLADDNANVTDFWRRELIAKNHQVTEARNAIEAMEAIQAGPYDLIVLEIEMPGNGAEIISWLRTRNRIPVVIYSASEVGREYVGTGPVEAFVNKTANPEDLLEALSAVLAMRDGTRNAV